MHEAKSRLSALVEAVESGREKEIVIARNGKPVARLIAIDPVDRSKRLGVAEGRFKVPDTIDEYEEEIIRMFEDEPIFPPAER
jgi:prevent-host-death family protein